MGSNNRKGKVLNVLSVIQVGQLARVVFETGVTYIEVSKLPQALKARMV